MRKKLSSIAFRTAAVFLAVFLLLTGFAHVLMLNQKNGERLKAAYTAETTVRRIEGQLNKYLAKSELLKNIVERRGAAV